MTNCLQDLKQVEGKNSDLIESPPEKIGEANDGGIGKINQAGGDDAYVFDVDARVMQIGRENGIFNGSMDTIPASLSGTDDKGEKAPTLKECFKPDGLLRLGRSRCGFPDPKNDHLVQLLVCKNEKTRETLDISENYYIAVTVARNDGQLSNPVDCDYMRIKTETKNGLKRSMAGVAGFYFRFYEPNTKYLVTFGLKTGPTTKKSEKKRKKQQSLRKTVSEITIKLETGSKHCNSRKQRRALATRNATPQSELHPASLTEEGMELLRRSMWVMKELQSLRDNARWSDFDDRASKLLLSYTDTDTIVAIKLEQSVAACYKNDLERSLQLIDESFSLMSGATNVRVLAGRGYGYRAGVKRRQRSLGEAQQDVQLAEQNIRACHTSLDASFIAYERANVLLDFIGRLSQRSPKQVEEALRNFEKCIDVCLSVEMQDEELYVKKHHFAFIKSAMLLLDCRTEAARERVLSEEFIAKGERCLKTLETKYWSQIAEGVKVQFYLASSDLEYRKRNYQKAENFASLAKDRAVCLGFNTEISHAQERLDHMRVVTRGTHNARPSCEASGASASEGEYADVSSDISLSGSELDWQKILKPAD